MEFGKVGISAYTVLQDNVHSTCAVLCLAEQNSTIIPSSLLSSTRISYPDTHTLTTSRLSRLSPFSPLVLISPTADSSLRLIRLIRLIHHHHHHHHFPHPPHFSPLPPSPRLICEQCGHSHSVMCGMVELLRRSVYWDGFDWGADGYFVRG